MSSDSEPDFLSSAVVEGKELLEEIAEELKTDSQLEKGDDESVSSAVFGFDEMKLKYIESQSEKTSLQDKLNEAESKLKSLEEALEPAVEEFDHLRKKFDIEKSCRSEAEKYASKLQKENKALKRQSQLLLLRLQPSAYADELTDLKEDEEENDSKAAETNDAQDQEEQTKEPEDSREGNRTIERALDERKCNGNILELERKLESSQKREKVLEEELKKFSRVSQMVWQECRTAKDRFDNESRLKNEAERFAHQMLSERDAVIRQSSILIASASGDRRLTDALLTIEDLTKSLEMERLDRQKEVSELKETLKSMDIETQQKSIEDLESQLQLAVEGSERLRKTTHEMETKIARLEEENEILRGKLQICEERLRPPSPSSSSSSIPSQSTSRFNPLRLFSKKNKKQVQMAKEEASRNKNHDEAIKEMMERIKTGQALKTAKTNTDEVVDGKQSVAMEELQRMLTSLKSTKDRKLSPEEEKKNNPSKNVEQKGTSKRQLRRLQHAASADNAPVVNDPKN